MISRVKTVNLRNIYNSSFSKAVNVWCARWNCANRFQQAIKDFCCLSVVSQFMFKSLVCSRHTARRWFVRLYGVWKKRAMRDGFRGENKSRFSANLRWGTRHLSDFCYPIRKWREHARVLRRLSSLKWTSNKRKFWFFRSCIPQTLCPRGGMCAVLSSKSHHFGNKSTLSTQDSKNEQVFNSARICSLDLKYYAKPNLIS